MIYSSTSGRKSALRQEYVPFDWKQASKASICAFMLAFAPLTGALAQSGGQSSGPSTNDNSDNSAATAPAAPAPAAPAPAAPANPAPASAASSQAAAAAATTPSGNAPTTNLGNVAVTGTAIARTDAATALPVTVVTKEQLQAQGITSTEQALAQIPQNNSDAGEGVGSGAQITGGGNFADLRGLGPRYTLVLLNGRRLSNDAFRGGTVDVNTIPFAAIERIEVLRDGASALYGTDAVAGVINFITKKDYHGGTLALQYNETTRSGGGNQSAVEATFGVGDLNKDRYNLMISGSYRRQGEVSTTERPDFFVLQDKARGVDNTSSFPDPANYFQGASPLLNPLIGNCTSAPLVLPSGGTSCRFNYSAFQNVVTPRDQASVYTRGTFKFNDRNQATLTYLYANNQSTDVAAPGLSSGPLPTLPPSSPYFPGNGLTPAPTPSQLGTDFQGNQVTFDPNSPITLFYRSAGTGPRVTGNTNQQHRAILDFKGQFLKKIHYDTYFGYNQGTTDISYVSGYYSFPGLQGLLDDGTLNPFAPIGTLSPSTQQSLAGIVSGGPIDSSKAREYIWNGKLTRELGDWFGGGQVAMAVAAEYKHEQLIDRRQNDLARQIANSGGGLSPSGKVDENRDVESVYSELNIPLLDNLEINGSFRYDNYSDIGDTVNPKVSLRYQPIEQVVLRGSYSEGFSAPTLHQEYDPNQTTFTAPLDDPLYNCNDQGQPTVPGAPSQGVCNYQFMALLGGNPDLQPQTSKSYSGGIIVSPVKRMSLGVDFWWIEIFNQIGVIGATNILNDLGQFGQFVQRNDQGQITLIEETNGNFGKTETSGVDFSFNYALPTDFGLFNLGVNGTLTHKYAFQNLPGGSYFEIVGQYAGAVIPKWKHKVTLSWSKAQWSANVTNQFITGYEDADTDTHQNVNSYMTFDASVSYAFKSGLKLELGSDNIFDRDPPFSNQSDVGFSGYDVRYGDPLGRTVFGRIAYEF